MSVPAPVADISSNLSRFFYGLCVALFMAFIWLQLTNVKTWQSVVSHSVWLVVSSVIVFLSATIRGVFTFDDVWQNWGAVIVDLGRSAETASISRWWFLAAVQLLVVASLWSCTLPFWRTHRWRGEQTVALMRWMPALVVGGLGLMIVTTIYSIVDFRYRYPLYGPGAILELGQYSVTAAVFAGLFPLPLLWLKGSRWWKVVRFFVLLSLILTIWIAEVRGRWIGQMLDYRERIAFEKILWFSLGCWGIQLWLGLFLFVSKCLQKRLVFEPETDSSQTPSWAFRRLVRPGVSLSLFVVAVIAMPLYLEPISLIGPPPTWQTAGRNAKIFRQCEKFGTSNRAVVASESCSYICLIMQPQNARNKTFWQIKIKRWTLIVGKETAIDGQLVDDLLEVTRNGSEIIEIVLAVNVDPDTLSPRELQRLEQLGFIYQRRNAFQLLK